MQRYLLLSLRTALVATSLLLVATPAMAQDAWAPLKSSDAALVTDGILKESPLVLPFQQLSVRNISPDTNKVGDDFEHVYAAPYEDVLAFFTGKQNTKGVDIISASVFPEGGGKLYQLKGIQESGAGKQLRLHHQNVSRDFQITLLPDGSNTRVIFHNLVLTTISSGVMPARHGFMGTTFDQELSFNWN